MSDIKEEEVQALFPTNEVHSRIDDDWLIDKTRDPYSLWHYHKTSEGEGWDPTYMFGQEATPEKCVNCDSAIPDTVKTLFELASIEINL